MYDLVCEMVILELIQQMTITASLPVLKLTTHHGHISQFPGSGLYG